VSQEPLPSATIVLVRDSEAGMEVLLLKRTARKQEKGPAPWVFPGGKVEDIDGKIDDDDTLAVWRRAAVREMGEEAGLVIDAERLLPISRWITPEISPKRFDTWFFFSETEDQQAVEVDGVEIERSRWIEPRVALDERQRGELFLAPPTFVTLCWIASFKDAASARLSLAKAAVLTFRPQVCRTGEGMCMLYPGDAGYATRDPEQAGVRHRLWALASGWRYERDV